MSEQNTTGANSAFTLRIDRTQELRLLDRFSERSVDKIMREAAKVGAKAAELSMRPEAPVGAAERLSQYYRRMGLKHGTLRRSVRAAKIRSRAAIGYVVGPIGSKSFTRHWVELGTYQAKPHPWFGPAAKRASAVAMDVGDSVLRHYADE